MFWKRDGLSVVVEPNGLMYIIVAVDVVGGGVVAGGVDVGGGVVVGRVVVVEVVVVDVEVTCVFVMNGMFATSSESLSSSGWTPTLSSTVPLSVVVMVTAELLSMKLFEEL
jgi:hypothetical protein